MKNCLKVIGALAGVAAAGAVVARLVERKRKSELTRPEMEAQMCVAMYSVTPEEMHILLESLSDEEVAELLAKAQECKKGHRCASHKECDCSDVDCNCGCE